MTRARILLADDHKEMRDKVARLLAPEFDVVGAVPDGQALLKADSEMRPDVCVIDISMPIIGGLDAASELKASGSRAEIVFLTVHEDPDFVQAALKAGALGYVLKSRLATELCPAIRGALAGRLFISPSTKLRAKARTPLSSPSN